jgi:hypothetical protein
MNFVFDCQSIEHRKGGFNDLFHQELPKLPIKNEFQRIQQFYRLALLMHRDGILHIKEAEAIKQTAIRMGLNPEATKRVLKKNGKCAQCNYSGRFIIENF